MTQGTPDSDRPGDVVTLRGGRSVCGRVQVPGDKSISHRAALLGAMARGVTRARGFLAAEDCVCTLRAIQALGVEVEGLGTSDVVITSPGAAAWRRPPGALDLGNSGTGMRLLLGCLAGQPWEATLTGDESLSRRPMDRIAGPLGQMGAIVQGQGDRCTPPVTIRGGELAPLTYPSPVASAQVKSAVLLAGLYACGITTVVEPARSRDHTERMLPSFGAPVAVAGTSVSVEGPVALSAIDVTVPRDISSAAYFVVAALLMPDSEVRAEGVLLNPTRAGLIEALDAMGAALHIENEGTVGGEPVGDVVARSSALKATEIGGEIIPRLLDEIPLLAVAATQAEGRTVIRDAQELRVKESDRLAATARVLTAMGARIEEREDGLVVDGPTPLTGAAIDAELDHRVAMSAAVAAQIAAGETTIRGADSVHTSFPGFFELLAQLQT